MMNNIKIPYLVYPIVFGLMMGWLVAEIAGGIFVRPKPLPAVKTVKTAKPADIFKTADEAISDNLFGLELKPADAPLDATGGQIVYNPDGTVASVGAAQATPPPPPFTAKLLGVLKDSEGLNSIAVINMDNGTVSIKLGGEKNGIKVVSLDDLSAVVEKDRKKYTITIERGESIAHLATAKKDTKQEASKTNNKETQSAGGNININLKRDEVRTELKDLNKILQSALVSPFYQDGQFLGYRVTRMREDSPLRRLGLQPGDTITRINGSELKSPELLFNLLSQIDDISAISLDMIRNTDKKTIFVEIQ